MKKLLFLLMFLIVVDVSYAASCDSSCTAQGFASGACVSPSFVASTELLSYGNDYTDITDSEANTLFSLFRTQGFTEFTMRLPGFSYTSSGATSTQVSNIKRLMGIADQYNLEVNLDLHTWYTAWDDKFRDSASNAAANRVAYIQYVRNTIPQFESEPNLKAWMVLNEPQARTASASENSFISDVIREAKNLTTRPVSVRFMMGYSPSTGHYATYLDDEVDFLCRNSYWDSRSPSTTVYGATQAKFLAALDRAHSQGKELWITEFGKTSDQVGYFKENVAYYRSVGVDRVFAWAIQTEGTESYNIFNGMTPKAAFYELVSDLNCPGTIIENDCSTGQKCCCSTLPPETYTAAFSQTGIPSGTTWGVNVGGTRYTSTTGSRSVPGLSGTVTYTYDSTVSETGTQYICSTGCSGSVTSSSPTATATYITQYYLTMSVDPAGSGTVNPSNGWYNAGSPVSISATANGGYSFSSWTCSGTGSYSGTANPATITMNSPITETANFVLGGGMVGLWHFDTITSGTTPDSSGKGNTGKVVGATITSGKISNALKFNGVSNNYVNITDSSSLDVTSAITIAAWINVRSFPSTYPRIVSKESAATAAPYALKLNKSRNSVMLCLNTTSSSGEKCVDSGVNTISLNTWYRVVGIWDGNTMRIYLNNVSWNTKLVSGTMGNTRNHVLIGINPSKNRYFNGTIDEVMIYNYALSTEEIADDYASGIASGEIPTCGNGICESVYKETRVSCSADCRGGGGGCGRGCYLIAIGPYIMNVDITPILSIVSAVLVLIEIIVVMTIIDRLHKTSRRKK